MKRKLVAAAMMASLLLGPGAAFAQEAQGAFAGIVPPIAQNIHVGMTRAEVEMILTARDFGPQMTDSTRYYQEPHILIEVPFDQTGGTWTPTNLVNGPVNVWPGSRSTL